VNAIAMGLGGFTFEGVLVKGMSGVRAGQQRCVSYTQVWRDGRFESVASNLLRPWQQGKDVRCYLSFNDIEKAVSESLAEVLQFYRKRGIQGPYIIMVTLLRANGYRLLLRNRGHRDRAIDRIVLALPPAVMSSLEVDLKQVIAPIWDRLWNACGYPSQNAAT
jgi:hypothetical protein